MQVSAGTRCLVDASCSILGLCRSQEGKISLHSSLPSTVTAMSDLASREQDFRPPAQKPLLLQ